MVTLELKANSLVVRPRNAFFTDVSNVFAPMLNDPSRTMTMSMILRHSGNERSRFGISQSQIVEKYQEGNDREGVGVGVNDIGVEMGGKMRGGNDRWV